MIDDQAVLVASIQGQIKEMTRTKNNLHRFAMKVNMARQQQSIGASMIAVSKALGSVTKNIQLEKAGGSTSASGRAMILTTITLGRANNVRSFKQVRGHRCYDIGHGFSHNEGHS
jgi:hypothetical protein